MQRYFVHNALRNLPRLPRRKIHLDFHNSHHISEVGSRFDAEAFAQTLVDAGVEAVVLFAKDMHGWAYHPSEVVPVHPGLSFDLLGEQVRACRAKGLHTYAYICSLWDEWVAEEHPEWLGVKRDRTTYLPKFDEPPYWPVLCANHPELVEQLVWHTREVLAAYPVDGIWYDMPIPRDGSCYCVRCLAGMRALGLDPLDNPIQRRYQQDLHVRFLRTLAEACETERPGVQVDFNNQVAFGFGERAPYMGSVDIEALPTAQWGYDYFPLAVRYLRGFGRPCYGMTGRFHRSWGDFGGLKEAHQMEFECLAIAAQGACLDIGDQMPPEGELDAAVYANIGQAFRRIEALEPFYAGAAPVTECCIVAEGYPLDDPVNASLSGLVKLLDEIGIQCDVREPDGAWDEYPCIWVATGFSREEDLFRLEAYRAAGGRVVWGNLAAWPEVVSGATAYPFNPCYAVPSDGFAYAVYAPCIGFQMEGETIAALGLPPFQRSAAAYTSHAQAPMSGDPVGSLVAVGSFGGAVGFDVGKAYLESGYWIYRELVSQLLDRLLPQRLVRCEAGTSVRVSLTRQEDRFVLHVLHWNVIRPAAGHPPYLGAPLSLADVGVLVDVGEPLSLGAISGGSAEVEFVEGTQYRVRLTEFRGYAAVGLTTDRL